MMSASNQLALEHARLSFVIGARIPDVPYQLKKWHPKTTAVNRCPTVWY